MNNQETESYYSRYRKRALLFQTVGIIMVVLAVLINELTGRKMGFPVMAIGIVGFIPLVIGGSSLRGHVALRSFASLLRNDPCRRNAEEFLIALRSIGHTSLTKKSMQEVQSAIAVYEAQPGADADLTEEIQKELANRVSKVVF